MKILNQKQSKNKQQMKNKILIYAITGVAAFFAPLQEMIYLILGLTFLDLITGILYSIKNNKIDGFFNRLKHIQSRKLRRSVIKTFLYILFLMSIFSFMKIIVGNDLYMSNITCALLCMVELRSISENLSGYTDNNVFLKVISILTKKVNDFLNRFIEK